MSKVFLTLSALLLVFTCTVSSESDANKVNDLNTAETFWDMFSTGRGYSGWGTGVQPQPVRPVYTYGYGVSPYAGAYGGYGTSGSYGNYGPYSGGAAYNPSNYYAKYPVYAGYTSGQPTYENYAAHGGHGFGKYGNY